jgi:hypothetical protein
MKNNRTLNQLTTLTLGVTIVVLLCYALIFFVPNIPINPFRPVQPVARLALTATPTATSAPPPTWTPTPAPDTPTPRATATPESTATPRASRTPTLVPTPTTNPLLPTRSPYKFTASTPIFMSDPYGAACGNWGGVGGQVIDIDGTPLKGVSVVGWGGPIPEQDKKVFVSGSDARINKFYNGDAGYELYIGAPGDFDFFVTVYENGRSASPVVKLRMVNDCRRDLVLINFQRNH